MIRLNVHQAKTHLSKYLDNIEAGEVVVICKRNIPIAELRPYSETRTEPRAIGLARGEFKVPDGLFDSASGVQETQS